MTFEPEMMSFAFSAPSAASAVPFSIAITGCGVVAPNGIGREAFAASLAEGRSGIGDIVSFDASGFGRTRAAEIADLDPAPYLRSPKNYLDRNSALAFVACELAARESGAQLPDAGKGCGISAGSMAGNLESLAAFCSKVREKGAKLAPPFLFPHTYYNTTAGLLSIEYGLTGPHAQFCSGAAAGLEAVADACERIAQARAGLMLAGGAEAFSEGLFRFAAESGWLSPADGGDESCYPFAVGRNGSILGEGAAFFVLERTAEAQKRGARILGKVAACAVSSSAREAMVAALRRASVLPESVDVVFAAAGGYLDQDREEAGAIIEAFGARPVPVVALKGVIGETLGAGGALNLAAALVAIESGVLPGTGSARECAFDGLDLVREAQRVQPRTLLVNAGSPTKNRWVSAVLSAG